MAEHLSDLVLDELALNLAGPEARVHLEGCLHCQERLAALQKQREDVRARPAFTHTLTRLKAEEAGAAPRRRRAWWVLAPLAGVALTAVVFLVRPEAQVGNRFKGAPQIELFAVDGRPPPSPLRPGAHLTLRAGGSDFLLMLAVDESGVVTQVWPAEGTESGRISKASMAALAPTMEVTPGDFVLYGLFSPTPLRSEEARSALERARAANPTHPVFPALVDGLVVVRMPIDVQGP
ncbi:MAG: hypothetical protein QM765_26425 [Myxococcales bacterium]